MPELCRFCEMIIRMYFDDGLNRHKPHIHVVHAEYEASVGLDGDLPPKAMKLLRAWLLLREDELYAAWTNAVRHKPLGKIEPLR